MAGVRRIDPERVVIDVLVALADAMDFRRVVEPGAAALTASRALAGDQRAWLVESARAAREAPDNAAHRLADSRFHLAVATLSGSSSRIFR